MLLLPWLTPSVCGQSSTSMVVGPLSHAVHHLDVLSYASDASNWERCRHVMMQSWKYNVWCCEMCNWWSTVKQCVICCLTSEGMWVGRAGEGRARGGLRVGGPAVDWSENLILTQGRPKWSEAKWSRVKQSGALLVTHKGLREPKRYLTFRMLDSHSSFLPRRPPVRISRRIILLKSCPIVCCIPGRPCRNFSSTSGEEMEGKRREAYSWSRTEATNVDSQMAEIS